VCVWFLALDIWRAKWIFFLAVLFSHLCPVWLYHILPHYLTNCIIFENNLLYEKHFWFSPQFLMEILRGIQRSVINTSSSAWKLPTNLFRLKWNLNFLNRFSKNSQMSYFIKLNTVRAVLLRADRRREGQRDVMKLIIAFFYFANGS